MPAWLASLLAKLPLFLQGLAPILLGQLLKYGVPALEKLFPGEAALIQDLASYLSGGTIPPALESAHAHFHAEKAKVAAPVVAPPACPPSA